MPQTTDNTLLTETHWPLFTCDKEHLNSFIQAYHQQKPKKKITERVKDLANLTITERDQVREESLSSSLKRTKFVKQRPKAATLLQWV